jgi:hypothetical protein
VIAERGPEPFSLPSGNLFGSLPVRCGHGRADRTGGFAARHRDDGSACEQVTDDGRVLIEGLEYRAGEAHMGGCVVNPVR